ALSRALADGTAGAVADGGPATSAHTGTAQSGSAAPSGTATSVDDAWYTDYRDRYRNWRSSVVGGERSDEFLDRYLAYRDAADVAAHRNGAMGMGPPAAVAAALTFHDRTVVAMAGDGCFMMNEQEYATDVHEGLDITVIVDDNPLYGTIVGNQAREYPGRPS